MQFSVIYTFIFNLKNSKKEEKDKPERLGKSRGAQSIYFKKIKIKTRMGPLSAFVLCAPPFSFKSLNPCFLGQSSIAIPLLQMSKPPPFNPDFLGQNSTALPKFRWLFLFLDPFSSNSPFLAKPKPHSLSNPGTHLWIAALAMIYLIPAAQIKAMRLNRRIGKIRWTDSSMFFARIWWGFVFVFVGFLGLNLCVCWLPVSFDVDYDVCLEFVMRGARIRNVRFDFWAPSPHSLFPVPVRRWFALFFSRIWFCFVCVFVCCLGLDYDVCLEFVMRGARIRDVKFDFLAQLPHSLFRFRYASDSRCSWTDSVLIFFFCHV